MRIDKIYLNQVGPFENALINLPEGKKPDLADVYLLVGPNGSGKSTALYVTAGIISCGGQELSSNLATERLRSTNSFAALGFDGYQRALAWNKLGFAPIRQDIESPFDKTTLHIISGYDELAGYYESQKSELINAYQLATYFDINLPIDSRQKTSWAAFAYAGMRSVTNTQVTVIKEPDYSPFENSLSFIQTTNTERLAEWIINQEFKHLKAAKNGNLARSEQLKQSVLDIERVVSEIIEEEFKFVTSDEDNNVRVRRNGVTIDMGLLPDGLKSIVSWIADLLMRLDRIPWVDDTPPMKRSFLLLLDEVDIHLHPSWQRKVLPIVQRMFPNAQIIASTHSPFVVASADDARIITFKVENGVASVESESDSQIGVSYSAVLRSIFGIDSEFDIETEKTFAEFHTAKQELLSGASEDDGKVHKLADSLAARSEELSGLIAIELRQMERQLAQRGVR